MGTALRIPFRLDGGRVQTTTDQTRQIEQKIVNVLTTSTYERVGLPDYGANISSLVFEHLDSLEFEDYRVDMATEVARSVTGVTIIDIFIDTSDIFTEVSVAYSLPLSTPKQFTFRLAVPGSVNEETPL